MRERMGENVRLYRKRISDLTPTCCLISDEVQYRQHNSGMTRLVKKDDMHLPRGLITPACVST